MYKNTDDVDFNCSYYVQYFTQEDLASKRDILLNYFSGTGTRQLCTKEELCSGGEKEGYIGRGGGIG